MAEKDAKQLAMSRALGAAFLNHQVEQLEKTVGPASGNWRNRRSNSQSNGRNGTQPPRGVIQLNSNRSPAVNGNQTRNTKEERDKFADIIVVDASVLVHAINQVKVWSRPDRKEVVVVPLEALNTLDLLKKGTTPLAQRARAASRVLEAYVGDNPRIVVQRDDDFVLWEDIAFRDPPPSALSDPHFLPSQILNPASSPEWVRRTICCAKFEQDKAVSSKKKMAFAVIANPPQQSPPSHTSKLDSADFNPVPLPPPITSKHEPRSSGSLVSAWACRASVPVLEIKPTPFPASQSDEEAPNGARRVSGKRKASSPGKFTNPPGLVERPPAVKAMMEKVSQPRAVVRVLARGEKLDPDT